jgi:hypothetical protein
MKITLEVSDVQDAVAMWLATQPHYLKAAAEIWLTSNGHTVLDSDLFTLNADGTITVSVPSVAAVSVASPVIVPAPVIAGIVASAPTAMSAAAQGHLVQLDPPLSSTGRATMFGLRYDGSNDPGDDRIGFFTDPATGKSYDTGVKTLIGASLPREILMSSFGISNDWKTPAVSDANTLSVWKKHADAVRQFALDHNVTLTIDSGGIFSAQNVKLVDAGPEAVGEKGCCIGNMVDLTYGAAHALNTKGDAVCTIELLVNGSPIAISGWDFVNKRVG